MEGDINDGKAGVSPNLKWTLKGIEICKNNMSEHGGHELFQTIKRG
jgi:hypothetical protein